MKPEKPAGRSEEHSLTIKMTADSLLKSAAALCARRECCRADFEKKWRAKAVPESEIEILLLQLEREGFIDESRYAKAFVID